MYFQVVVGEVDFQLIVIRGCEMNMGIIPIDHEKKMNTKGDGEDFK